MNRNIFIGSANFELNSVPYDLANWTINTVGDQDANSFTCTPNFNDDYSLASSDTCAIDHGQDISAYPTGSTDFFGTTRTGGAEDIGAVEYTP